MFELLGVGVIEWFLWGSISEGSTGIQKQFELSGVYCTWVKSEPQISRKERFIARYLQYGVLGDSIF